MQDFSGKKILLLDGLSSQCLEYAKAFNKLGCDTTVLCDSVFDTAYASRHPKHKILGICNVWDIAGTEQWILKLVRSKQYDVIIPFTEYSARILAHHKKELNSCGHIVVNEQEVFDHAQDKNYVMRVCMENNVPCPRTFFDINTKEKLLQNSLPFPIIFKPRRGFGAHGFSKIKDQSALLDYVSKHQVNYSDLVVQECLPVDSLIGSANLFIDKKGEIKSSFLYHSARIYPLDGGSGILNITFNRADAQETCARLVKLLHLRGPVGIDFMIDPRDNKVKIIEVNVRPLACAKVGFLAGVDVARQILEDIYAPAVTPMMDYQTDIRVRRSQMDWVWFLKSPLRFKAKPSWFDRKNTTDQLFSWSDPGPWLAFFVYGLKKIWRERKRS